MPAVLVGVPRAACFLAPAAVGVAPRGPPMRARRPAPRTRGRRPAPSRGAAPAAGRTGAAAAAAAAAGLAAVALAAAGWAAAAAGRGAVEVRGVRVVAEYAHDAGAFTQGLAWSGGRLYESTGLRGRSSVRRVEAESGAVERAVALAGGEFGEGCAVAGGELVQVVWKAGVGHVYALPGLERLRSFRFAGDGWGVAADRADDRLLYVSDGSAVVRVMRRVGGPGGGGGTAGLREVRRFTVRAGGRRGPPVGLLNELEMVGGELWANVWQSPLVARIDVATGVARRWVDLGAVARRAAAAAAAAGGRADVANGIAWDAAGGRLFVTGKLWPRVYVVEVEEAVSARSLDALDPFFLDPARCRRVLAGTVGQ